MPFQFVSQCYWFLIVQAVEILEQLVESGSETMDVRNKDEVISRMRAAVASKQFGQEEIICSLVADVIYSLLSICFLLFHCSDCYFFKVIADLVFT